MARDWHHLFITDRESVEPDTPDPGEGEERRRGFFGRLRTSMRKTREALQAEVQATLFEGDLDAETWERLEEALIYADVGARTTAEVVEKLEREAEDGDLVGG
ncbi:MAG: signal recognition particle receptor subunit alpha, partial [Thermoleophilia bacterium]